MSWHWVKPLTYSVSQQPYMVSIIIIYTSQMKKLKDSPWHSS